MRLRAILGLLMPVTTALVVGVLLGTYVVAPLVGPSAAGDSGRPKASPRAVAAAPSDGATVRDDVLSALVNLGYHRPLAEKAVDAAVAALAPSADAGFERTLKTALRELAK